MAGAISGSGPLSFTNGTFTLTANNSGFAGATNISSSAIVIADGTNALAAGSAFTLADGSELEIAIPSGTTASQTIGSLAGNGIVSASGPTGDSVSLNTGGDNTSTAFSGVVTDASQGATLALTKIGTGTFTLAGANTYSSGTMIAGGTLAVASDGNLGATSGVVTFAGGTLETTATLVSARAVTLKTAGTVQVDGATTSTLSGVISGGGALAKTGAGTLTLTGANAYGGGNTLANFNTGASLDLKGLAYTSGAPSTMESFTFTSAGAGTLSVMENGVTEKFALTGVLGGTSYFAQSDGNGGTLVNEGFTAVCYCTGTRIRTTRGDVAVENLAVGDLAITASGGHRPITWIGHRDIDCGAAPVPSDAWPVRIRAGAFGIGANDNALPERELRLSPGHPVLVGSGPNEHLVPIMCLINGTSVDRVAVDEVTYWHVELDEHDILIAENLPAESFLDYGNRAWFGPDAEAHALANPDFVVPGLGARCRPVALDGPLVEAERRRLEALFATSLAAPCAWPTGDGKLAIELT